MSIKGSISHYRKLAQKIRICYYGLFSDKNIVEGCPSLEQPVLFSGKGKIVFGKDVTLGVEKSPFFYNGHIYFEARKDHSQICVGNNSYINNSCVFISEGEGIFIGDHAMMGTSVTIYDSDFHELSIDYYKRLKGSPKTAKVSIGNNVFIGSNSIILKGVTIGDNTIIGAGSIVVKSIPDNVLAAGNPCNVIRRIEK